ncbi:hypothetical protein LUZ63_017186 [Rhynchospora breviuscula]|uniref:non-specific serine/threonine protein kinase n=1 Tax=Rhynchospora breviuscula TaxID=2022672 RepID=A0A9Q0HF47_9POAL|nr:hypothetical protein LUZ63_017186 [Rhynchospora breviuscula]
MAIARKPPLLYTFITFLYLLFSLKPHLALGMSAITANQSLTGDRKLTSAKGKFVVGFFKPGNASNNWYIGIWFGNISQQTVVWVANRENPVTNAEASKLAISSDGNLVLLNQNQTIVWSTHAKNASFDSTEAVMLDTGNLVLRNRSNTSVVLWQSFDHLTHAWLPGSKLGLNKITGVNQNLISWKDDNNPAPGLFSFQPDQKEQEFFLWWNNSIPYWESGKWEGNFFENAPEMGSYENTYITFNFTNDETGFYLTYWVLDDSIISGNIMSISGQLQSLIWNKFAEQWSIPTAQPKDQCKTLGKGGFGSVYKGTLPNSTVVAVKRLRDINQSDKSFRAEVSTIGNIQHLNLIRLVGFCSENGRKLLVYEYMPVGSLDKHLFGNSSASLTWETQNILLDKSFVPKIADFGLAKLLGREFSRVLTSMRGTIGYLAPEWIAGSAITTKADVYSYGMMLFEIISGKRNRKEGDELEDGSQEEEGNLSFFPAFAANKLVGGDIHCLVDLITDADCNLEELERALKVALWCVQIEEEMRPSMRQVVQILEGQLNVNMPPIPRSFQVLTEIPDSINFFSIKPSKTGPAVKVPTSTIDE